MRILVLGVTGMLGNAVLRVLAAAREHQIYGTLRGDDSYNLRGQLEPSCNITHGVDVENNDSLVKIFGQVRPDAVVNCVGLVKQLGHAADPLLAIPINSLLPHRLAALCRIGGARLIQISTDCVFSGEKGNYVESDVPDATDLYGRTKLLGEVSASNVVVLRTSIVGHELRSSRSLINWFLTQSVSIKGFSRAIFSGVPTVVLARIIRDIVLPAPDLQGLYHIAAEPISKYDLLNLVREMYGKQIEVVRDDTLVIDRSLNADRFRIATGYVPPAWPEMVRQMHEFR